jgi:hypothetical protein
MDFLWRDTKKAIKNGNIPMAYKYIVPVHGSKIVLISAPRSIINGDGLVASDFQK